MKSLNKLIALGVHIYRAVREIRIAASMSRTLTCAMCMRVVAVVAIENQKRNSRELATQFCAAIISIH